MERSPPDWVDYRQCHLSAVTWIAVNNEILSLNWRPYVGYSHSPLNNDIILKEATEGHVAKGTHGISTDL